MALALAEARLALAAGEVPVGAAVVDAGGNVLALAHNQTGGLEDATAHAELLALQQAQKGRGKARLCGCTLYVTLEPCAMCAGAALLARVDAIVFGAFDPEAGCCGSVLDLTDELLHHRIVRCVGGAEEAECTALLRQYFQGKRMET
ncbi:MAG: nucleoside deaminase [Clostridia bacterium]|nr:nucleoside deaminase [Clostridia bacterium]